jgi:CRP-like cAMP-binding protein
MDPYFPTTSDRIIEGGSPVNLPPSPVKASGASPADNRLLAAIGPSELQRWGRNLEWVTLPRGHVIYEPGVPMRHAYFPTTAAIALMSTLADGASAELAVVGNEGFVGVSLIMGGISTPSCGIVRSPGMALRIGAGLVRSEFQRPEILKLLLRYTQALITQIAQMAVCNRHHQLEQQLCRWLLLALDRVGGERLTGTHELIAEMLGVRREGVTAAAVKLQKLGLISYSRGRILVHDRAGIEHRACECYGVVRKEYERLLPSLD